MNREIKFRAWHKGYPKTGRMPATKSKMIYEQTPGQVFMWLNQPIEIMQYTGLRDKNGTEIYEGDILKEAAPRGNKYRVVSVPGGFAINMFQDELPEIVHFESLADMQNNSYVESNCEIIGNIYQNKNLIEP